MVDYFPIVDSTTVRSNTVPFTTEETAPQPWVHGFQPNGLLAASFHPTAEGMRAAATAIPAAAASKPGIQPVPT
ncbi:hypothetical protein BJF84_04360 [Rhodococcus sp. CUA-806]|nr:hypothetical protein BJF84_04360 [Rhodococcus sp. CUA-806]